jgi:hypothetical protein
VIVQNKLTPLNPSEAAAALAAAYERLIGAPPSQPVLALLIAQSALETGNWKKLHNYNFGNQKAGVSYPLIVQFRCSELVNGVEKFFDPPAPECNFRAYENAAAGALDYLRVLHARPHWWQGLQTEDPSAFVDALATPPKYFTANPALYKSALTSLFVQYGPLAVGALGRPIHPPAGGLPTAPPSSSTSRPVLTPLPLQDPQSTGASSIALPLQQPATGSDSPSGWGSLPSGSWLLPQEELVGDDSGVRTSVVSLEAAQARRDDPRRAIDSAARPSLLLRLVRFIARLITRALGRSSA